MEESIDYGMAGHQGGKKMDIDELILELEIFNQDTEPEHNHYLRWLAVARKIKRERTQMLRTCKKIHKWLGHVPAGVFNTLDEKTKTELEKIQQIR